MKTLQTVKAKKNLLELLTRVPSLRVLNFVSDDNCDSSPITFWSQLAKHVEHPDSKLGVDESMSRVSEWLCDLLQPVVNDGECYISVGGFGELPWLKVDSLCGARGVVDFLTTQDNREIIVLDKGKQHLVAIMEEEDEYYAFLRQIPEHIETERGRDS